MPATIGRYRVDGRLGKGATGIVYSAYDEVIDRPVAIKVMTADVQDDPDIAARFYREALAAGQLDHRNIITILDLGAEDGRPFIVMEQVRGRTLGEFLKRPEGVNLELKVALMVQLCDGLQLAHGRGIFHRDIKPGNLLVSDDGTLKIVDFGMARLAASSMTLSGLIVGTPDYMSPEQARARDVDERSDIFSVGGVFYYMLTGRKPFAAADMQGVLHKVQFEEPPQIRDSEAPAALVSIVMRALAKAPEARYQKTAALWADLVSVERQVAIDARKVSDEVRTELDALAVLAAERRELSSKWKVLPGPTDIAAYRQRLERASTDIADWLNRRGTNGWDWSAARERQIEIKAMRRVLEEEIASLRKGAADLEKGEQLARDGDLTQALNFLESAVHLIPSTERGRDERSRVMGLLAERRRAQDRARALVIEAEEAAKRDEWAHVLTICGEALASDPGNQAAVALLDRATDLIISETRIRKQQSEKALDRAEKLARKGRFAEAELAIKEAKGFDLDPATAAALEMRIRNARLDQERATAHERRAAEVAAKARTMFEKGDRAQALEELRGFLARELQVQTISAALARMTAEADRLAAENLRREKVTELTRAAEAALDNGDPEHALEQARDALAIDASDALAQKIQSMASARLRERVLAEERMKQAVQALENARGVLKRGKFAAARQLAHQAAELQPGDEEPASLLVQIGEEESRARESAQRHAETTRRAAAAAPVLAMAKATEEKHDFIGAEWLAENALALDPDCVDAQELLTRVRVRMVRHARASTDEMVRASGKVAADADDTVTVSPSPSSWQTRAKKWIQRISEPIMSRPALRGLLQRAKPPRLS